MIDTYKLMVLLLDMHFAVNSFSLPDNLSRTRSAGVSTWSPFHQVHLCAPDGNRAKFQFTHKIMKLVGHFTGSDSYSNMPGVFVFRPVGLTRVESNNHLQIITNNSSHKERDRIFTNTNSGIGTKTRLFLPVLNGKIGVNEVNISSPGWVDYSFGLDSDFMPLSDMGIFNKKKGRLLNSPTEKEVIDEGPNLLELNIKLLEKMEEQTLYVIPMNKKKKSIPVS